MSRRDLLLPMILVGVIGMFGMNFQITLALVAKGTFHKGAETYGALSALLAAGALLGALASARRDRPRMSTLVVSALGFSLAEIVVALMPTLVTFGVLLIANGALLISFTSTANATVQLGAGPAMRGRVMALYGLVFLGGTPVGGPLIGWLAQHYGPRSGLLVGGFASLLVSVVVGTVMWRHDGRTWHHLRPHHLRRFYGEGYDVNALR
jgi:MFS family permease